MESPFWYLEVMFMPAKKATVKKKAVSKEPSWDQIGKMVGAKIEKEANKDDGGCCSSSSWCTPWHQKHEKHGHFAGALLFGIILAVILNQQAILLDGVRWWLQALLVFGWALMWG